MLTVTVVVSLASPLNDGFVSFDGDVGWFKLTTGEAVFTTKVTGLLLPAGFPNELGCVARAVYVPLDKAGLASPELQPPPVPDA
ncbi:MAG TPA: hypothetical protein VNY35_07745, partial [Solirubrobacteraceae bacterium]|nr:hypothetical protein [Solirubrobacteraceae bacterium]